MLLPLWLIVLLVTGFVYGLFIAIKNITNSDKNFWIENKPKKEKQTIRTSKPEEILLPMFHMSYVPRYRLLRGSLTLFRKIMKS